MSDDLFDNPGSADTFTPADHNGQLLLIKPLRPVYNIPTQNFGDKDAIEADIHFLDGPQAGTVLKGAYVFPLAMQGQLKGNTGSGRFNLGRLTQGVATKGTPPWKLADPNDADKDLARRYIASDKYKANNAGAAPAPAATPAPAAAPTAAVDPWASSEPPF